MLLPTPSPTPEIRVYVSGAVLHPGTYAVEAGDRFEDVLELAGGATADADLGRANLALRVTDEAHLHIPRFGEAVPTPSPSPSLIDVNAASVEELQTLRGIGPVLAEEIVAYRQQNGPFFRVEDLLLVTGIGPKTLEDLRDSIAIR